MIEKLDEMDKDVLVALLVDPDYRARMCYRIDNARPGLETVVTEHMATLLVAQADRLAVQQHPPALYADVMTKATELARSMESDRRYMANLVDNVPCATDENGNWTHFYAAAFKNRLPLRAPC